MGDPGGHFPQGRQALRLVELGFQAALLLLAPLQDNAGFFDDLPQDQK